MIVEFVGCTGAGKTTLMRAVQGCASSPSSVTTAWDLVMDRPGRRRITNPHAINLMADATALTPFFGGLRQNGDFVRFALRRLFSQAPSLFARLNYARNVVRRVGMHELARQATEGRTVLVDEGTALIAYQLFVYSRAPHTASEIEQFANLVPLPDRVIHVKAPTSVLVERALKRPDRRRELKGTDAKQLRRLIERADAVFDAVTSTRAIRDRVIVVHNPDTAMQQQRRIARHITASLTGFGTGYDAAMPADPDGRKDEGAAEDS